MGITQVDVNMSRLHVFNVMSSLLNRVAYSNISSSGPASDTRPRKARAVSINRIFEYLIGIVKIRDHQSSFLEILVDSLAGWRPSSGSVLSYLCIPP